jgi:hypothetical protein
LVSGFFSLLDDELSLLELEDELSADDSFLAAFFEEDERLSVL